MLPPRERPPHVADRRVQLVGWLDLQRALVPWKCEGMSEPDAHRAVLPSSPLMTMAGVVSHLRWVEHLWFEVPFHMVEETARHVGQRDAIREILDGETGYY